jgi:hypothetical protein
MTRIHESPNALDKPGAQRQSCKGEGSRPRWSWKATRMPIGIEIAVRSVSIDTADEIQIRQRED